ncbi:P4 family phage/plasmid primase-like protein [Salinibacter ruber]|uniref:phage/plasmid primase, P4 family n=1 Tax=Salinibacter ruber TaxID=146919 RepID=UPI0021679A3D|nr:phage/plasmid primase, P4 family [Salinibacter ruber]MCS4139635.1 P4 family phage/plasmid primase-like protein [Salinibacter ruber]
MIDPSFDNIPEALRERNQWILWSTETRDGDPTKAPKQPGGAYASSTDSDTWMPFSDARDAYASSEFDGIGFVFDEEGPFVGVDLDGCVKNGDLTGGAWDVVKRLDSYTERSPSGTGLHIICRGFLPDLGNRSSEVKGLKELELYDQARYFTFTGRHLDGTPEKAKNRAQEIYDLCREVFDKPKSEPTSTPAEPNDLEDQKLIEKARNANDGGKFARLWNGDTSEHGDDHSRADLALVSKLAFWTGGDRDRIDQLFRKSGLCREKWTERPDYRKRTIDKALDEAGEFYDPSGSHRQNGQAEKNSSQDDSEGESDPWAAIRSTYSEDRKAARLEAAEQVSDELHVATDRASGQCYVWDEDDKVLDPSGDQRIGELLVRKLRTEHSQHEQNEITEKVRLLTAQDEFGGEYIPVANGDLFLDSGSVRLEDADPERAPLTRSDAAWDPDAECPCFKGHLQGVMPSEQERVTLQEYAGYCLLHWDIPFHKALFMIGPTASGKSTTLTAIRKLMGRVSKLSPQQLVNGRFGPAELEGAWANVRSDISSAVLRDIGLFKEVVAGDPIFVERKYEQGYNIRPTAKHLYSANQLPEANIDDDAFYRRILLVSFPTTIPKDERVNRSELDARLEQELDGILRWAVEGLQSVLDQNGFTHDLSPKQTRRRWESRASSIGRFKVTALNVTGDHAEDFIPKEKVFSAYTQFCNDRGLAKEDQNSLTRSLTQDPKIADAQRTPPGHSRQVRCYTGFQLDETAL